MSILFIIAALVAVVAALMVISRRSVIHALIYLIISFLAVAMTFFLLGAPFVAIMEIIIYAGAILVLFLFVVMMLNIGRPAIDQEKQWMAPQGMIAPIIMVVILLGELGYYLLIINRTYKTSAHTVTAHEVGQSLFGPYLLAVELVSFLFLAGIFAAYHLSRLEVDTDGHGEEQ